MKWVWRSLSLFILTSFLGFAALEATHQHTSPQADTHCVVCKVTHQTPTLGTSAQTPVPDLTIVAHFTSATVLDTAEVVFTSHGLSPPSL